MRWNILSKLVINGGQKLKGKIFIRGAKNSALPILAAAIMCNGETVIHNCPSLSDVMASIKILKYLGFHYIFYLLIFLLHKFLLNFV